MLFDEVEKAHPDVFNILLQVLDDGILTDSHGRVVDFKQTLIILTSNLGAQALSQLPEGSNSSEAKLDVMDAVRAHFRPEFLNRIDEIIVFNHLSKFDIWEICGLMVNQLEKRLREKDITLEVDVAVRSLLTEVGYDPIYGARPLRRAVMKLLEDTLAQQCLTKPLYPKTRLVVKRVKKDNSLVDYTNEVEVEIDYTAVDPELLKNSEDAIDINQFENISNEEN